MALFDRIGRRQAETEKLLGRLRRKFERQNQPPPPVQPSGFERLFPEADDPFRPPIEITSASVTPRRAELPFGQDVNLDALMSQSLSGAPEVSEPRRELPPFSRPVSPDLAERVTGAARDLSRDRAIREARERGETFFVDPETQVPTRIVEEGERRTTLAGISAVGVRERAQQSENPLVRFAGGASGTVAGLTPADLTGIVAILWSVGAVVKSFTAFRRLPEFKVFDKFAKENNIPKSSPQYKEAVGWLRTAFNMRKGGAIEASDDIMAQFYTQAARAGIIGAPKGAPPVAPAAAPVSTVVPALVSGRGLAVPKFTPGGTAVPGQTKSLADIMAASTARLGQEPMKYPSTPEGAQARAKAESISVTEASRFNAADALKVKQPTTEAVVTPEAEVTARTYPIAKDIVDGRTIRLPVPNQDSIEASLEEFEILSDIREVPMSAFPEALEVKARTELAEEIAQSGEITPLIVVIDDKGAYILEGANRFDALVALGAKSFPAQVVIDRRLVPEVTPTVTPEVTTVPEVVIRQVPSRGIVPATRPFEIRLTSEELVEVEGSAFHGTGGQGILGIIDKGFIETSISRGDELGKDVVSLSKFKAAADNIFIIEVRDPGFRDRSIAVKGDVVPGLEVVSDKNIPISEIKSVTISFGSDESLATKELVSGKTLGAIKEQLEAKGIKVNVEQIQPTVTPEVAPQVVELAISPVGEVTEPTDIVARLFRAFRIGDENARLGRVFLRDNVVPAFMERFGDAPQMDIRKRMVEGTQETLLEVTEAGWEERVQQLGLQRLTNEQLGREIRTALTGKKEVLSNFYRIPQLAIEPPPEVIEPTIGLVAGEARPVVPVEPAVEGGVVPGIPPTQPPPPPETVAPPTEDPVAKLTQLIRSAKPVRAETELLKHEELSKRAGALARAIKAGEGEQAFQRAKGVLAGELPQAVFDPPRAGLTTDDVTGLFNTIRDSGIQPFQKLNTSEALSAILGGKLPTRGDIALLEEMFGSDLAKALLAHRPLGQKAWDISLQLWNIPRTLMASGELSASLRQGAYLLPSHPKHWGRSMWAQLRATAKEKWAIEIDRDMQTNPGAELRDQYKVFHAPVTGVGAKLSKREEVYMVEFFGQYVNWWEKTGLATKIGTSPIYVIAKGVRIGERAYITFLNKMRADIFDSTVASWEKQGVSPTPTELKWLARFVNDGTGRGGLGKLEDSAPVLSGAFFSPRLQASRIGIFKAAITDVIRAADDIAHGKTPNRTSKEGLKAVVSFVGTGLMILGLLKLNGWEVSGDSNSADFGKAKKGKMRIDIWSSFQPYARFVSNMITGTRTSTITGENKEVKRSEILENFARSKLMPSLGIVFEALEGRTYEGEDFELNAELALDNSMPMFWQDMYEAIQDEGLAGAFRASPGFLGVGIMTYDIPSWPELAEYFYIEDTVKGGVVTETAMEKRKAYRINNPENEAKLFILGRFTTLKTEEAKRHVLRIMAENEIKPEDVRGYQNVFGAETRAAPAAPASPRPRPDRRSRPSPTRRPRPQRKQR